MVWSAAEQLSTQGVRFVIGIVLARLLLPSEFGLLAMLGVFVVFAQVFAGCGFGQALIQKQNASRLDESSVFYVNLLLGLAAALILFLGAPWVARFYRQPQLVGLTRILAADVLISAFSVVQITLLNKKMDFKTQLKVGLIANGVSGAVAIAMAVRGMGVMSLAAQLLVGDTLRVVLLWKMHEWRPMARFSLRSVRELFSFGSRIFASGLVSAVFQNLYPLIIGKLFTPASLGFFSRARQMQALPAENLSNTVNRVSFPLFSTLQHDIAGLKRAVRKAIISVAFLSFPIMTGLACIAFPLVRVLLTDKWLPSVALIQVFCIAGALYPLQSIHSYTLMALGRSDYFFRVEVIKKVLGVIGILLTFRFGVIGLVWGDAGATLLCCYVNAYYTVGLISYSWREQILDLLPYLCLSVAMAVPVLGVKLLGIGNTTVVLLLQICVGVIAYATGGLLFRLTAFEDARGFVQHHVLPFVKPAAIDS